jgi:hypothetical protein
LKPYSLGTINFTPAVLKQDVMSAAFKKYKAKFRYALRPFFVMINGKRKLMKESEWNTYLLQIKQNVLHNPVEFLGKDLPDQNLTNSIVDDIFKEFRRERLYLDSASQRAH